MAAATVSVMFVRQYHIRGTIHHQDCQQQGSKSLSSEVSSITLTSSVCETFTLRRVGISGSSLCSKTPLAQLSLSTQRRSVPVYSPFVYGHNYLTGVLAQVKPLPSQRTP